MRKYESVKRTDRVNYYAKRTEKLISTSTD